MHRPDLVLPPRIRQNRSPEYTVLYQGKVLCRSKEPFFAGARALKAMGLSGEVGLYGPDLRLKGTIEKAAGLTVDERDLTVRKYRPWTDRE